LAELVRRIQLEDLALVALTLLWPLLAGANSLVPVLAEGNEALGGLIALIAAVGAMAAMATRVPGESRVDLARPDALGIEPSRIWIIGPFIGAVGFVAGDALDRLGLPGGDALIGIAFVVATAALLLGNRLPVISRELRRVLVAPFVFLSAVFFQSLAADLLEGLGGPDGPLVGLLTLEQLGLALTVLAVIAFVGGIFYTMLIFVPRELADPGASTRSWVVRYAIFFASLAIALYLGDALPLAFS